MCTRTRSVLDNPKDAKSRRTEYFFITNNPGNGIIAKNRLGVEGGKSFLPVEIVFDPTKGEGDFSWILNKAKSAYEEYLKAKK
jgi:hypothetical protein